MVARRFFLFGVLGAAACARAAVPGGGEVAAAGAADGGGLDRLARVLEKQLALAKGDALPWRESILVPATARLVWRPAGVRARPGGDAFRPAFDPLTHWYFVALVAQGSDKPRFFGPLEETRPGVFVESFGVPPAPAASAAPAAAAAPAAGKGKNNKKKARKTA